MINYIPALRLKLSLFSPPILQLLDSFIDPESRDRFMREIFCTPVWLEKAVGNHDLFTLSDLDAGAPRVWPANGQLVY